MVILSTLSNKDSRLMNFAGDISKKSELKFYTWMCY